MLPSDEDIEILRRSFRTKKYPTRWITYRQRIQDDAASALANPAGKDFFNADFVKRLEESGNTLQSWQLKLFALQATITLFIAIGYISPDSTVNLLGVSLKQSGGMREVLLATTATVALLIQFVNAAKQAKMMVAEAILKATTPKEFSGFSAFAAPSPFHLKPYLARHYDRWMFPTRPTRILFALVALSASISVIAFMVGLFGVSAYVFIDVYLNPAIGWLSYATLIYVGLVSFCVFLWVALMELPLPFQDSQALKRLHELKKTDKAKHDKILEELASDADEPDHH